MGPAQILGVVVAQFGVRALGVLRDPLVHLSPDDEARGAEEGGSLRWGMMGDCKKARKSDENRYIIIYIDGRLRR